MNVDTGGRKCPAGLSLEPLPSLRPQIALDEVQARLAHLPRIDDTVLRITTQGALPLFAPPRRPRVVVPGPLLLLLDALPE